MNRQIEPENIEVDDVTESPRRFGRALFGVAAAVALIGGATAALNHTSGSSAAPVIQKGIPQVVATTTVAVTVARDNPAVAPAPSHQSAHIGGPVRPTHLVPVQVDTTDVVDTIAGPAPNGSTTPAGAETCATATASAGGGVACIGSATSTSVSSPTPASSPATTDPGGIVIPLPTISLPPLGNTAGGATPH